MLEALATLAQAYQEPGRQSYWAGGGWWGYWWIWLIIAAFVLIAIFAAAGWGGGSEGNQWYRRGPRDEPPRPVT